MAFHCLRCRAELDRTFKACPHCGEAITDFVRRYSDEPLDGKYRLVARLGTGGMGEVYRVEHTFLGNTRVVKVIRPQISENAEVHERFLREARLATKVQHPNVATLHDFSALPDGAHYMVWEFIDGENLGELLRLRGTLPPRRAVRITIDALHGLEAIHRAGIVHRDISPENLMLTREHGEERVKIIDLGVARSDESDGAVTQTGMFVGKLRYASPEHLGFLGDGERIDGRADLYSLAIVLYEMLSGRPPHEATTPHQYIAKLARDEPMRALELTNVPGGAELEAVLRRALERDRSSRYAGARELAAALEEVEKSLPVPAETRTVDTRFDPDATMRVATPSQPVDLRAVAQTSAPVATPRPVPPVPSPRPPSPATVRTSIAPISRDRKLPLAPIVVLLVLIAAGAAAWLKRDELFGERPAPARAVFTATQASPARGQTAPSVGAVDVVAPQTASQAPPVLRPIAETATATETHAATQTSTHTGAPVPSVVEPKLAAADAPASSRVYVENGDSDSNEAVVSEAHARLANVKRVAIVAEPGPATELAEALSSRVPGLTVVGRGEHPDAVIEFRATQERAGFGRKRRAAQAAVSVGGRTVFAYRLDPEIYRVGDTPAEAFANALASAME
jgi:eukaryotic-like serine/threonine-protein kinase